MSLSFSQIFLSVESLGSEELLCQLLKTRLGMEHEKPFWETFRTVGARQVDWRDEGGGERKRKKGTGDWLKEFGEY